MGSVLARNVDSSYRLSVGNWSFTSWPSSSTRSDRLSVQNSSNSSGKVYNIVDTNPTSFIHHSHLRTNLKQELIRSSVPFSSFLRNVVRLPSIGQSAEYQISSKIVKDVYFRTISAVWNSECFLRFSLSCSRCMSDAITGTKRADLGVS